MWWLKLYILICVTWIDIVNWDDDMIWIDELDMNIDYCGCDVNCHWEMINFGSDYDELLTIDWFVNVVENDVKVNCVCVENYVIEKDVEKWDENWDVDDERLNWAFEIVDLRIVELRLIWWNLWIWLSWWIMWIACVWW